ncbi:1-phosphofructokinase family hexose kinase [Robertkochia solimangrovi]|uniref:1-phosphofructokinase family hexose kinase n=1 Tax=Robertkochia solimangrovi TaxID=2213046 RepID=UPI001180F055|nr:PfkB family carbohydrate kinase [Robertkochia solimangrovi]TRZ41857.1 1-phosphofructokinase [Robertkochia solimangrovi]
MLIICPNPSIDTFAWITRFSSGTTNRFESLQEYPGGKGTHIAFAQRELGQDATLLAFWGGRNGSWIKEACLNKGIDVIGPELDSENRKCYTIRSQDQELNNTELLEPGPFITKSDWQSFLDIFKKEIRNHRLIIASGSWPAGTPESANRLLSEHCHEAGKDLIIDCNGSQLKNALKSEFFGIHLNEPEAGEILGTTNPFEVIEHLKKNVKLVAYTKGKQGLWLYFREELIHACTTIDNVISTVGSGDCLTAGIAFAIERQMANSDIATYGVACGAANCLNEELGMLRKTDVESLLPLINIKNLSHA